MTLEQRVEELEKKVAALEEKVQEQPSKTEKAFIEACKQLKLS